MSSPNRKKVFSRVPPKITLLLRIIHRMVTRQADKRANLVNENLLEEIVTSGRNAVPSTAFTQAQTRNEVNQKTK